MVVTQDTQLPDDSELNVQELNLTYSSLFAGANYVGKKCEWNMNEFYLCRHETKDPRKCLKEGNELTACAVKFFQDLRTHCKDHFEKYTKCLECSSSNMEMDRCRKTQAVLDKCVLENLKIERPSYGYFTEPKVHNTNRPKVDNEREFPDASEFLPPDAPRHPAKMPYRHLWQY